MLELKNLEIIYPGDHCGMKAVDKVNFRLEKGRRLGIIGESGCGKSSLALSIMGLNRDARISGEIIYQGRRLNGTSDRAFQTVRWNKIAMMFQNGADVLNPVLTLFEQIDEALKTHGIVHKKLRRETALSWFERVGLDRSWAFEYPHRLSGGMRQRALLAMALCCNPELLILDEPTSSQDAQSSCQLLDVIDEIQKEQGFSLILISHQLTAINRLTTELMTLYAGQVMETGPTDHVLKHPMHPYTRGLINASPDYHIYKELWGIPHDREFQLQSQGCPFEPRCVQKGPNCSSFRPPERNMGHGRTVACNKGGIEVLMQVDHLHKSFVLKKGPIKALEDVSFNLKSGEILAVLGKTGSGKSTLAHVLSGLYTADHGRIRLWEKGLDSHSAIRKREGLQIVFQDPYSSTSHRMSVIDTVKEPLDILATEHPDIRTEQALHALTQVELPVTSEFLKQPCHVLSGGQRQRLALARSLTMKPRILIADEITSMLDPSTRANLLRTLMGLQNSHGFSMMFITHDIYLARKVADHVLVMDQGRCIEQGSSVQVFQNPSHPRTRDLMGLIKTGPNHHMIVPSRLYTIGKPWNTDANNDTCVEKTLSGCTRDASDLSTV